jgi:hypothetical protein
LKQFKNTLTEIEMKIKYNGLEGIAALKAKREDEKMISKPKAWAEKVGIITRISKEMGFTGTRAARRMEARIFKKDPLNFMKHTGFHMTKRGRFPGLS